MYDFDADIRKVPDFPKPGILFYDITSSSNPAKLLLPSKRNWTSGSTPRLRCSAWALSPEVLSLLLWPPTDTKNPLSGQKTRQTTQSHPQQSLRPGVRIGRPRDSKCRPGKRRALARHRRPHRHRGNPRGHLQLVTQGGVDIAGVFSIIGLPFLGYPEKLAKWKTQTLIQYHSELNLSSERAIISLCAHPPGPDSFWFHAGLFAARPCTSFRSRP